MDPSFVKIHLGLFSIEISQGTSIGRFVADDPLSKIGVEQSVDQGIYGDEEETWILKFDGSVIENSIGTRIVIMSPRGVKTTLSFNLAFECTNNQAKYEALVISLEILLDLGAKYVQLIGDSQLVLRLLTWEYAYY